MTSVKFDTANCSGELELSGLLFGEPDARQHCLSYITSGCLCSRYQCGGLTLLVQDIS